MLIYLHKSVTALLMTALALAGAGCIPVYLDGEDPLPEPEPNLEGYWMIVEAKPAVIEAEEEGSPETDIDFLRFTKLTSDAGDITYVATQACGDGQIVAHAYLLDEGVLEINDLASGATLRTVLDVDADGNETLRAVDDLEEGSWTAQHIETPNCDTDAAGQQVVEIQRIELDDDALELVGLAWEEEEPLQARAIVPGAITAQDRTPNGAEHLAQSMGSRLSVGEERGPIAEGNPSTACTQNGTAVSCDPAGGHGAFIQCVDQGLSQSKIQTLSDISVLIDTDQIYPGALLQGNSFNAGNFTPITIARAGGVITMTGLYGTSVGSRSVTPISFANVNSAIVNILSSGEIQGTAANASYRVDTAYSSSQWAFQLGTTVKTMGLDLAGSVDTGASSESNTVVMKFTQVFYTVSFEDPASRTSVFADGAQFDDPEGQIGTGNPPLYVSNVKYGRQVFLIARSSLGSHSVTAALKGAYNGLAATVTVDSGMSYKDVMKNTAITYVVRGGDAGLALEPLRSATADQMYDAVRNLLANRNAATWSPQNPGIPVAYTLRYLDDRSVAMKGLSTTYDQHECRPVSGAQYKLRLASWNINNDVKVLVDGAQVFYQKRGQFDVPLNGFIPADSQDHALRIVLSNGDCFTSHAGFNVLVDGASVWAYNYNPRGWKMCNDQVDLRFTVNPTTGTVQQTYFWHR